MSHLKNSCRLLPMPQSKRPLLIGVTGNIGSGKSAVCKLIADAGYRVVFADVLANQRLEDNVIIESLVNHFGTDILVPDYPDRIDRRKLSVLAFSNEQETTFLNSVMHPPVLRDMQEIVETADEEVLFFEVPLLFEASLQVCFDFVILIYVPADIRIKRLLSLRQNLNCIKERIASQVDDTNKFSSADLVLDNSGNLDDLNSAVAQFLSNIINLNKREVSPFTYML
mgnify:FL=1